LLQVGALAKGGGGARGIVGHVIGDQGVVVDDPDAGDVVAFTE
jgi:hypothetical protein